MGICKRVAAEKRSAGVVARVGNLVSYITNPELTNGLEKCIYRGEENFIGSTQESRIAEMIALAQESVHSKDPIDHWMISLHDDEKFSLEQAKEAVSIFLKQTGLEGHQVVWGVHDDTKNRHIHIAVNRMNPVTGKVTKINNGFNKEAGQQVIALIEHAQGWKSEKGARYTIINGKPVMTEQAQKTKAERIAGIYNEPLKPSTKATDMEVQTGTKSEQRIGIEQAAPIILKAKSWAELHAALAIVGMEYRREGSGAKIYIDGNATGVKASDVLRAASFGSLQKRLGAYQPPQEINKNDYHHVTRNFDATAITTLAEIRKNTGNSLRILSKCTLAFGEKTGSGKTKRAGILQLDARADRRADDRLRRNTGRGNTRIAEPLNPGQPGWKEYQVIREELRTLKATATTDLSKKQSAERSGLFAKLKAERAEALKGNWKGRGDARNILQSYLAIQQAASKLELSERHKSQRKELRQQFKPLPQYRAWKDQPQIVAEHVLIEQHTERDKQPQRLSEIIKSLTHTVDRHNHITYQSNGKDIFRDEGKTLAVLDQSSNSLAATLAVAQQKYGNPLTLTGSVEFKRKAVAAAVAINMFVKFADPVYETMRVQMVEQQRQTAREALAQARVDEQKRIEAAAKREALTQARANTQPNNQEDIMATQEERDLAKQATAYKKENPNYQPPPDVLAAVDAVLIEQAQERIEATRLLTAADWITLQAKPEKKEVVWQPGNVEFSVLHVADQVVINMGLEVARRPLPSGIALRPGMRVVISKDGSLDLAPQRPGPEHDR